MALPYSRNRTYGAESPVVSADLNDYQDQIIAAKAITDNHEGRIVTTEADIVTSEADIAALEVIAADHESRISAMDTDVRYRQVPGISGQVVSGSVSYIASPMSIRLSGAASIVIPITMIGGESHADLECFYKHSETGPGKFNVTVYKSASGVPEVFGTVSQTTIADEIDSLFTGGSGFSVTSNDSCNVAIGNISGILDVYHLSQYVL